MEVKESSLHFFQTYKTLLPLLKIWIQDKLMAITCEYFNEFSKIIVNERGTIDKYIGDSIMAFWGAPLRVERPAESAARSGLKLHKD